MTGAGFWGSAGRAEGLWPDGALPERDGRGSSSLKRRAGQGMVTHIIRA